MRDGIVVESQDRNCAVRLVAVCAEDGEMLRQWKNAHREAFFHKDIISASDQAAWMAQYLRDDRNAMFLVEWQGQAIGCMGFRLRHDGADIYNVMLARKELARQGLMSQALRLLCGYVRQRGTDRIYLHVLSANTPARAWYAKNGFREAAVTAESVVVECTASLFDPVVARTNKKV